MRHSKSPEVNAGSMADIAFLLLMFFLVTSAIPKDKGFQRTLPGECPPNVDCTKDIHEKNLLRIMINDKDEIMVDQEQVTLKDLKDLTKKFVDNNGDGHCAYCHGEQSALYSKHPTSVVISLQAGKQTSYAQFIAVQDALTEAYFELRNRYAHEVLGKTLDDLSGSDLHHLKRAYPFVLSEVETN